MLMDVVVFLNQTVLIEIDKIAVIKFIMIFKNKL